MENKDLPPSYEAAVGILDSSKLPRYTRRSAGRFHPYKRQYRRLVDDADRFSVSINFSSLFACLMPFSKNILDDEYVSLNAPPAQAPGKHRFPSFLPADSERVEQMLDLKHVIQLEKLVGDLWFCIYALLSSFPLPFFFSASLSRILTLTMIPFKCHIPFS
jgi:hypothetical protein